MAKVKKRRKRSYTGKGIGIFMAVFMAAVGIRVYGQVGELKDLRVAEEKILKDIEKEKEKAVDLQAERDYYTSDAYIESIARQQLGLIMADEKVFINRAEN